MALRHARDEIHCACLTSDLLDKKPETGAVDVTGEIVGNIEEVGRIDDLLVGVAGEHGPNTVSRSRHAVSTSGLYRLEADELRDGSGRDVVMLSENVIGPKFGDWKRRSICKRNNKLALYLQTSAEMIVYHGNGFAYIKLTESAPLDR